MDRILVTEKIAAAGLDVLRQQAEVDVRLDVDKADLPQVVAEYDALIVRSATKVTADVLAAAASRLRVVGRAGSGVDNIDVEAATQYGITVVNAPASNSVAVAELTLGLVLAMARQIPQAYSSVQAGKWERSAFMGWEVRGKTLGLVGLGRIGAEVARRARGFAMHILTYDPLVSFDRAAQLGVEVVTMDELLSRSDIVSMHVPLTDQTRNLFDEATIAKMKPGSYLINASRGGIVDEAALRAAIDSGHLAGAATDVFSKEPPPDDNPLVGHPKIITTPHLGASTQEAQDSTGADVAEGVLTALAGGTPRYAVNAPFIAPEEWRVLEPYIQLGTQMGMLCRQVLQQPVGSYELEYCGELTDVDTLPVRLAVMQGLLAGTTDSRVTPVNAPLIARDRGLNFDEKHTAEPEMDGYAGLLYVRAHTADGTRQFAGTVLHNQPYIVETDGYPVSFVPGGPLVITYHRDQPGIIGRVGTLLGAADVNISGMYVGRLAPREKAMMVLTIDEPATEDVLTAIKSQPGIDAALSVVV